MGDGGQDRSDLKLQTSAETTGDEQIRLHATGDKYIGVRQPHISA